MTSVREDVIVALILGGRERRYESLPDYASHHRTIHGDDRGSSSLAREVIHELINEGVLRRLYPDNMKNLSFTVSDYDKLLDSYPRPVDDRAVTLVSFYIGLFAVSLAGCLFVPVTRDIMWPLMITSLLLLAGAGPVLAIYLFHGLGVDVRCRLRVFGNLVITALRRRRWGRNGGARPKAAPESGV